MRDLADPRRDSRRVELCNQRNAFLRDRGLLRRNVGEAVAEELLMIERQIGYARDQRLLDDIGCIETAAEPHVEYAGIGRRACEGE